MKILVSNDDGYQAPGIHALFAAVTDLGHEGYLVAPDQDRSGASHSLSLKRPLYVTRHPNGFLSVEAGTPSDCVHLALTGLLDDPMDMVVSGINAGPNMGDDVLYSGTVAAAVEGRHLGFPAIALSMNSHHPAHYATGAAVAQTLLRELARHPLPADTILNVNIPDVPLSDLQGYRATRLGNRHRAEPLVPSYDPRGRRIYWIGPAGAAQDAGEGTDFHAVAAGYVSVTPLQIDLTRYPLLDNLGQWVSQLPVVAS